MLTKLKIVGGAMALATSMVCTGGANAMPAAPSVDNSLIVKVERVCQPNGYCFNKYTGAPMANPLYRHAPPGYYERRGYRHPRHEGYRY